MLNEWPTEIDAAKQRAARKACLEALEWPMQGGCGPKGVPRGCGGGGHIDRRRQSAAATAREAQAIA
ncbi:hypothetical protein ACG873_06685 [Mesorhizobium sp. AaZ16]|uniref:hypothetical protein n=1 Tax=Mesorhizobium sp. AaZ16 TaxID=3402289 RepID=UPI00374EB41E